MLGFYAIPIFATGKISPDVGPLFHGHDHPIVPEKPVISSQVSEADQSVVIEVLQADMPEHGHPDHCVGYEEPGLRLLAVLNCLKVVGLGGGEMQTGRGSANVIESEVTGYIARRGRLPFVVDCIT